MNTNKKHKLKKEAEDKLKQYLNEYELAIKNLSLDKQNNVNITRDNGE
tara:strand:+ start:209 stop:352 length:144 start_codon:yes stop_codon:yes gene_type:complete